MHDPTNKALSRDLERGGEEERQRERVSEREID